MVIISIKDTLEETFLNAVWLSFMYLRSTTWIVSMHGMMKKRPEERMKLFT